MRYVARFHTHPPGEIGFSGIDKRGAAEDRVLSFVGVMRDNVILRYSPANGQTDILGTIDASVLEAIRFVRAGRDGHVLDAG